VPLLRHLAVTSAMTLLALLAVAALVFSVLAGMVEGLGTRRWRRPLQGGASPVLHPFARHGARRRRSPLSGRALHHAGLFVGFLLLTFVALMLARAVRGGVTNWF
jgi:hypothetical protein